MSEKILKRISLQNFKSWKDTKDIDLGNITLLYGTNSAWKSSLIQFFLLLKQTIDSSDENRVLLPGGSRGQVDLGTISDFFHKHDLENELGFSLSWRSESKDLDFRCKIVAEIMKGGHPDLKVDSFSYERFADKKYSYRRNGEKYELVGDWLKRNKWRAWSLPAPIKFYKFPKEVFMYYQDVWNIFDFPYEMERLFEKIIYIGPLRRFPERTYEWSWERPSSVWTEWEYVVEVLLSAKNEEIKLNRLKKQHNKDFQWFIAEWLKDLGLVYDFKVKKIADDSKVYKLFVQTTAYSPWVDIADVWFWVSQILPILVQAYYAKPGSIIILEQPEIHLHPKVQSILADVFINASKRRWIQFIIESHSEHLLRRMQRRIADHTIENGFVKSYFCTTKSDYSEIEELKTDEFGNISNWPENFFWDEVGEMEAILEAQLETKILMSKQTGLWKK